LIRLWTTLLKIYDVEEEKIDVEKSAGEAFKSTQVVID